MLGIVAFHAYVDKSEAILAFGGLDWDKDRIFGSAILVFYFGYAELLATSKYSLRVSVTLLQQYLRI